MVVDLNYEQKLVKEYDHKNAEKKFLRVEAGPGAGKTRVLIEKITHMVQNQDVKPETLLIITFSNKAAEELQERLADGDLLKSDVQKMHISTIHSFCGRILEENGRVGLNIISDDSGGKNYLFIEKHMKELGFINEAYMSKSNIKHILNKYNEYCSFGVKIDDLIEYIKTTRPVSEEYINLVHDYASTHDGKFPYDDVNADKELKKSWYNAKYLQIAKSYPIYENILRRENAIDYSHMQKDALEIAQRDDFTTPFTNILVDEFQDTDPIQMALFEELMKNAESFTVVGDINQSIYGFRGSNTNPFTYLAENHGDEFEFMSLPTNYRSTHEIIDISEDFIKHQRPDDSALGKSQCGRDIHTPSYFLVNQDCNVEALNIYNIIDYLINEKHVKPSDIGILLRSVKPSTSRCIGPLIELLDENNVGYQIIGLTNLIEKKEIKSVLTLFFYLVDNNDPHKYFYNKWEKDWLNLKAFADQTLFNLSDETKEILYSLQDEFEAEVVRKENEFWLEDNSRGGKKSFEKVFERDEELVKRVLDAVERPLLVNEKLIDYGITNADDLEFFKRLNQFKDELYADDVKFYERPTAFDVYLKLLTEITGFLNEDLILENEEMIQNVSQITDLLSIFSEVRYERDIRGAFWFIYRTIENYSAYLPENDGIQIMTIHSSKGLEFPVVIVPSIKKGNFPMEYQDPNPESGYVHGNPTFFTPYDCLEYPKFDEKYGPELSNEMEEERIIYVAMTRAEDVLILSSFVNPCGRRNSSVLPVDLENLPHLPERVRDAINANPEGCKLIDPANIEIEVPERTSDETDEEEYCINLSFTSLENYNACPFRYELANDIGFNVSEKSEIDEGIFVHRALEIINKKILVNGNEYIGNEEVISTVEKLFKQSNEELFEEDSVKYENDLNEIVDNVIYYYENYGKDIKILDSEYPFYLKDKNYALTGVVDLIFDVDGKLGIIDYKNTSLESKYKDKFKKQLHLYVLALRDQNQEYEGREISELKVYTIKSKKIIDFEIDEDYIEELKLELERVARDIHEGKFKSSKCDDCKYCSYKNICNQSFD